MTCQKFVLASSKELSSSFLVGYNHVSIVNLLIAIINTRVYDDISFLFTQKTRKYRRIYTTIFSSLDKKRVIITRAINL